MRRRAMNTSTPSSSTAPIDSSVNTASHPPGIGSRCTAKYETRPEMTIAMTAKAIRSSAIAAAVTAGGVRS